MNIKTIIATFFICCTACTLNTNTRDKQTGATPQAILIPSEKFLFNNFVDCNMATVWVGDTFRIFPGKYGEDPLWGEAHELKFASGSTVDEVFKKAAAEFTEPHMPANAPVRTPGLHGAVWFETLFKDSDRKSTRLNS